MCSAYDLPFYLINFSSSFQMNMHFHLRRTQTFASLFQTCGMMYDMIDSTFSGMHQNN